MNKVLFLSLFSLLVAFKGFSSDVEQVVPGVSIEEDASGQLPDSTEEQAPSDAQGE